MILLVDVGNSRVKWLLWDRNRPLARGGLLHRASDPATLGERLWGTLEQRPGRIIVANVAGPDMQSTLAAWSEQAWSVQAVFVSTAAGAYGVRNAYPSFERLGVDRWVALLGARSLTRQSCCVVDCGTAVTVDALAASGEHLGGVIVPGVRLMREALYRDTRQIPAEDSGTVTVLATNTRDGVWGGTMHAVTAAIDRVTARMAAAMGGEVIRFLTGGDAEALRPMLEDEYRLEPDLIFYGLLVLAGEKGVC